MRLFDRDPDYYRTHDSLPMLRRVMTWGSCYQMLAAETLAEVADKTLADSKYHVLALVLAVIGPVLGTPFLLSLVIPKRYENALQKIDEIVRKDLGFPPIRRDTPREI